MCIAMIIQQKSKTETNISTHRAVAKAYSAWVDNLVTEYFWQAWMLNFMFVEMHLSEASTNRAMQKAVEDFYARLITRFHRKPRSAAAFQVIPRMIGCPDYPIPKRRREGLRLSTPNRGQHFNAILFHPIAAYSRTCRLHVPLDQHIEENRPTYCPVESHIDRIDLEPLYETPKVATTYVLKALENRRIGLDDILVLPRSSSEL